MLVLDVSAVQANSSEPRPFSHQLSIAVGAVQHENNCDRPIAHSPTQRSNRESAGQRFASFLQGACCQQKTCASARPETLHALHVDLSPLALFRVNHFSSFSLPRVPSGWEHRRIVPFLLSSLLIRELLPLIIRNSVLDRWANMQN